MFFGNGTHSKRDPRHYTLDFYTKVQVWGRVVKSHYKVPSPQKAILGSKEKMMLALPCYKKWKYKKREKQYKIKKEKKEKREGAARWLLL